MMTTSSVQRSGAASVLILVLTSVLFIAVVFSIDIARIQLAQLDCRTQDEAGVYLFLKSAQDLGPVCGEGSESEITVEEQVLGTLVHYY